MRVRRSENKLVSLISAQGLRRAVHLARVRMYTCTRVCVHVSWVSHTYLSVPAGNEADQDGSRVKRHGGWLRVGYIQVACATARSPLFSPVSRGGQWMWLWLPECEMEWNFGCLLVANQGEAQTKVRIPCR